MKALEELLKQKAQDKAAAELNRLFIPLYMALEKNELLWASGDAGQVRTLLIAAKETAIAHRATRLLQKMLEKIAQKAAEEEEKS